MHGRRILGVVGALVALGVALVVKLVVLPHMQLAEKKKHQWDDAREELRTRFIHPAVQRAFAGLDLTAETKQAFENCILDKAVDFLNHSGCDYYYVSTTTSRSEALKKQEACLRRVKFAAHMEDYLVACVKSTIPNDWSIFRKAFQAQLEKAFAAKISDPAQRKKVASCVTDQAIKLLKAVGCTPVDTKATKPEDVLRNWDKCAEIHPGLNDKVASAAARCAGQTAPRAAARPGGTTPRPARGHRHHRHHRSRHHHR